MGNDMSMRVGIDLAAAAMGDRAPGTARLVSELALALFKLPVPWTWVPVFSKAENPLRDACDGLSPLTGRFKSFALHASFELGHLWRSAGCQLGYAMAYFTPFFGPPVVANFFDANFYENVDAWHRRRQWLRHQLTRSLFHHSIKRADRLFVLSDYGRRRLIEQFPETTEKWVIMRCGFSSPNRPSHHAPGWAKKIRKPFFFYAGSFSDNKNQRSLLEAWALLQRKHADAPALVMAGPGPEHYMSEVIAPLLKKLPRCEDVILPGRIVDDELGWAFQHAHAYVQPSIAEGFCMPLLEAMACKLPVACSNTTSLPETAGPAALFFNPHQPREILASIETLWQEETTRKRIVQSGSQRVAEFSWEKTANIVAGVIEDRLRLLCDPTSGHRKT